MKKQKRNLSLDELVMILTSVIGDLNERIHSVEMKVQSLSDLIVNNVDMFLPQKKITFRRRRKKVCQHAK